MADVLAAPLQYLLDHSTIGTADLMQLENAQRGVQLALGYRAGRIPGALLLYVALLVKEGGAVVVLGDEALALEPKVLGH